MAIPLSEKNSSIALKIIKLQTLARSQVNRHEALLAGELAASMLKKYNMTQAQIDQLKGPSAPPKRPNKKSPPPPKTEPKKSQINVEAFKKAALYCLRYATWQESEQLIRMSREAPISELLEFRLLVIFHMIKGGNLSDIRESIGASRDEIRKLWDRIQTTRPDLRGDINLLLGQYFILHGSVLAGTTYLTEANAILRTFSLIPNNAQKALDGLAAKDQAERALQKQIRLHAREKAIKRAQTERRIIEWSFMIACVASIAFSLYYSLNI
jgi:hypothetical protein